MANLMSRLRGDRDLEQRYSFDQWVAEKLLFDGHQYPLGLDQTIRGDKAEQVDGSLSGYMRALRSAPPAFGAQLVRSLVLSQARFTLRNRATRKTYGTTELDILEKPWPNGTTGELITKMEWQAGVVGNAYVVRRGRQLKVLHPDWVSIVLGSGLDVEEPGWQIDAEVLGYHYKPGGPGSSAPGVTLAPNEVAHWSPLPDPEGAFRGMSWVTPAIREIQGDSASTTHKLKFFENGATPNLVVSGIAAPSKKEFDKIVEGLSSQHDGVRNAYRTLYLSAGVDATVVGSDLKQIDFKATQGAGETRISVLSRVPAPILGISEGLAGSSLNAGNLGQARRNFADSWIYPTLQSLSAALEGVVAVPSDSELWHDTTDMPILREDAKDAADITARQAETINGLVREGFVPESAKSAVIAQDMSLLEHTGKVSVQLQDPNAPTQGE